jgi:hypothetical protein
MHGEGLFETERGRDIDGPQTPGTLHAARLEVGSDSDEPRGARVGAAARTRETTGRRAHQIVPSAREKLV